MRSRKCTGRHIGPTDPLLPLTFKTTCLYCGIQVGRAISPQPANDTPDVLVEIRATEIANELAEVDRLCDWTFGTVRDDEERRGWSLAETNMRHHTDRWHAGYLARCIATHDTEQERA